MLDKLLSKGSKNSKMKSSGSKEEANFIRDQANLSREAAHRKKEQDIRQLSVIVPLAFQSKDDYLCKLKELLVIERQVERLTTEMIAEKDVEFSFDERLEIYSRLRLRVPKTIQQ